MEKKKKTVMLALLLSALLLILGIIGYSFIYDIICKVRVYDDLEEKVTYQVMLANIKVMNVTVTAETEDVVTLSYGAGASGVIFSRSGNTYYALTAAHVVSGGENTEYSVRTYPDPDYGKYSESAEGHVSYSEYYDTLSQATVEYIGEKYDLAVISFQSDKDLSVLEVSDIAPQYADRVVSIGGHYSEEVFSLSYGSITTREPVEFGDEEGKTQYRVIRHSAYEKPGDSGSALLNENMEIAGINLGGGTDVFGNFRYGLAMPCDRVLQFLAEWEAA